MVHKCTFAKKRENKQVHAKNTKTDELKINVSSYSKTS